MPSVKPLSARSSSSSISPTSSAREEAAQPEMSVTTPLLGVSSGSSPTGDKEQHDASIWKRTWQRFTAFYQNNIGLFFVFLAQVFASLMSTTARLLETGFEVKFHALQIIFVRMLATSIIGSLWMWYKQVPDFPLGARNVRWLLVLRGLLGSAGLFGLYYSLSYLDISESTVITFLVPTLTAFVCWVALREPFTIKEALAGLIAFIGVLFIAKPGLFMPDHGSGHPKADTSTDLAAVHVDTDLLGGLVPPVKSSPAERTIAVVCAILGSFAAASAYATIRVIGMRAHSLLSVNYFAVLSTVSSFLIIMIHPDLHFETPQTLPQWALLVSMGISGFLLQVLLTEGLQREKAGRATNLIYSQLVFALIIERVVWGTTPPPSSLIGGALIIASAIWVSLQKNTPPPERQSVPDEERSLLNPEPEPDIV